MSCLSFLVILSFPEFKLQIASVAVWVDVTSSNVIMMSYFVVFKKIATKSYMLILNPSHHSCQHANQTLTRATPSSIRNTSPADFVIT